MYFQLNVYGKGIKLDLTCFEFYTTNDPTAKADWFSWVGLRRGRRRWSQSLRISFHCDGGGAGDVIHVDLPLFSDIIISNIMCGLAQMECDMGKEAVI